MLRAHNARGCLATTVMILCVMAATHGVFSDRAEAVVREWSDAEATQPDPGMSLGAAELAADWLGKFSAPSTKSDDARVDVARLHGLAVTLRTQGRNVSFDAAFEEAPEDRVLLVRTVTGRAMSRSLSDRMIADAREKFGDEMIGRRLSLEMEFAGALRPLAARTTSDLERQIEPGMDGIAIRVDNGFAARFPSQMRSGTTAASIDFTIGSLAAELGLPVGGFEQLKDDFGLRVYAFRVVHVVQPGPERPPMLVPRGDRLVSVDAEAKVIDNALGALSAHVIRRLWSAESALGMHGDYDPIADRYDPIVAGPRDQALMSFALARAARLGGMRPDRSERASTAAWQLLLELSVVEMDEQPPLEVPLARAAIVLAAAELDLKSPPRFYGASEDATPEETAAAPANVVVAFVNDAVTALRGTIEAAPLTPTLDGAVNACAFARLARGDVTVVPSDARDAERSRALVDASLSEDMKAPIALLPWLFWAEAWHPSGARDQLTTTWTDAADALMSTQALPPGDVDVPADLIGGFRLGGRPDSQSLRPAIFLAAWKRLGSADSDADPGPAAALLQAVRQSRRFVMQLSVQYGTGWRYRTPDRAVGGVRSATWSEDMPAVVQAMGLLAYAEAASALSEPPQPSPAGTSP